MRKNRLIVNVRDLIISLMTVICMLIGHSGIANAGVNYWTPVGPEGGNVTSLAVDPAMPYTVYAGTSGGVYKSINRGDKWYAVNSGLKNLQVSALAIDPLNSAVIYAGTAGGVYKSPNGGGYWQEMNNGLAVTNTISLVVDPVTTTTIYAGTKNGLFKSMNGGTNWFPTSLTNTSVIALAIDPIQPLTVYAVQMGMSRGILKSVDGGMSWSAINNNIPSGIAVTAVALDPVSPTTIYAGGPGVIFKSTNAGMTWQFFGIPTGQYQQNVQSITVDPVSPSTVYAVTSGAGGYKSINGGTTWSPLNIGLTSGSIVVDPLMPSIVYAGGLEGVFGSIDGGTSWKAMNAGINSMIVYSVAVDSVSPSTIYAGTLSRGVYKSTDQGANWNAISSGMANDGKKISVNAVIADPITPSTIYAGTYGAGGGIYKSTDGGANWNSVSGDLSYYVWSLAIDPLTPSTVYAGTDKGALKSADGGATWQAVNYGLTDTNQLPLSPYSLAVDPVTPSTIYAGTYKGVYKSTDGGASWTASSTGILYYAVINALSINPITPSIIYAGTSAGVYKSTDGGANWQAVNSGLTNLQVNVLVIDSANPSTIYAGTSQGVFKSTDGGASWQLFSDGLTNLWVKALAIDPVDSSTVYAGTYGSGVFSITQGTPCALTVQIAGTGSGVVTSSPLGINCGNGGSCWQVFKCSTPVTLLAASNADAIFTGWSGDADCADGMVTMDMDKTCISNFAVHDTTPPVITVPSNISMEAAGPGGTAVVYTVTAVDGVDGAIIPSCTPPSGTIFPMGTTVVTCSAKDAVGNTSVGSFTVFVWNINPSPFSFAPQVNSLLNTFVVSNSIIVTGINAASPMVVTGGEYSVNNGGFTSLPGNVNNGDSVTVRLTSSRNYSTEMDAILTIGGVSGTFKVTTLAADTIPDPIVFNEEINVSLNALVTSNTVTVTGVNTTTVISVSGGNYSINGGPFTAVAGLVDPGDTVRVQQLSAGTFATKTDALVTIGGVSAHFSVTTKANTPPTANAGTDQTAHSGALVTLDGSGSSDPDGNVPLTYAWSILSRPYGSTAALSDPGAVNPTFTPDVPGDYVIQLVVTDSFGAASAAGQVLISTKNTAPVAYAGPDQLVTVIGSVIKLDGSKSWDPDGDVLTYQWSFVSVPEESIAKLNYPDTIAPYFMADKHGTYVVQLIVSDAWEQSKPVQVTISFENIKPIADAGTSQAAMAGDIVTLNGSGSTDANGDLLTYSWSFTSVPAGSLSAIVSPTSKTTSFVPDLPGLYVAQLIVNDGFVNSDPATIQVEVIAKQSDPIDSLRNIEVVISSLDGIMFKNPNMKNALINKLNAVIASINDGHYSDALDQLQNDILGKMDGCAKAGAPDKNDWIINCKGQGQVYPSIVSLIQLVQSMK